MDRVVLGNGWKDTIDTSDDRRVDYDEFVATTEQADRNSEIQLNVGDDPNCDEGTLEILPTSTWR